LSHPRGKPRLGTRPRIIRHAGLRWEVLPGGEEIVRCRGDWSIDALSENFREAVLRRKRAERVVFRMAHPGGDAVVKAQLSVGHKPLVRSLYGRNKGRKEWENHLIALDAGLPIVQPLAYGELKKLGMVHESVVISEWRPGAITITEWRRGHADRAGDAAGQDIAAKLGRLVAAAQGHGIYHNEISFKNVLIENAGPDPQLVLIDWKHARIRRRTTQDDVKNVIKTGRYYTEFLAHAVAAEPEKRAFLRAYLDATADRPDRAEFLAGLRRACPAAEWIDAEFDG